MEGLIRFLESCRWALRGIGFAVQSQRNLRIQTLVAIGVVVVACLLHLNPIEMAILAVTIAVVLAMELFNTALEYMLNVLEARDHPMVRAAKDTAAGATLVVAIGAAAVGLWLLGPRLWTLLKGHHWEWGEGWFRFLFQ
jgi:undecaprenol kinase